MSIALALQSALEAARIRRPEAKPRCRAAIFGEFGVEERAEALGVSTRTVINDG
jgi:hypothetical protein